MSSDINQKLELILEQVEKILSRKVKGKDVPPQLKPQKLHQLYKDIKMSHYNDSHKLKLFQRWEEEVFNRIVEYVISEESFDIKSLMLKSDAAEAEIHHEAQAFKEISRSLILKYVQEYFKNTSHAWLIEYASYRKKDFYSFMKFFVNYPLTHDYLKKTYEEVCRKEKKKKHEKIGEFIWEKILEETKEYTNEDACRKFSEKFGKKYWEEIHVPYLEDISIATNDGSKDKLFNKYGKECLEVYPFDFLNIIHRTTGMNAGKMYCDLYGEEFWEVSQEDLNGAFNDELEKVFPRIYLAHRKSRARSYRSGNEFVTKQYYSRSKKGIVHLVRMHHQENDPPPNSIDLVYPFINSNRLVLYFWLEQIEPILTPKMILTEIVSDKNIGRYEQDVFLVWLWEVGRNTRKFNNISTRQNVKKQILQLLTNLFYQALHKEPLKDKKATDKVPIEGKYTISQRWKKFRWMKNNAKNARLKPLLVNNKTDEEYNKLKKMHNLPDRKRLEELISNQSKL